MEQYNRNNETMNMPYTESEILALKGIILSKENSKVYQRNFILGNVSRNGNVITLHGLHGETQKCNVRGFSYANQKKVKGKKPFNTEAWNSIMESEIVEGVKPNYNYRINVICEATTRMGFAVTFKPLIPLTAGYFQAMLEGKEPKAEKTVSFVLGSWEGKTKSGLPLPVNFGLLNGNSGISIYGTTLRFKHLPNSVHSLAVAVKGILEKPEIQQAKEIWEVQRAIKPEMQETALEHAHKAMKPVERTPKKAIITAVRVK